MLFVLDRTAAGYEFKSERISPGRKVAAVGVAELKIDVSMLKTDMAMVKTSIDNMMANNVTRADIAEVRADIQKAINESNRWSHAALVACLVRSYWVPSA